MSGIPAPALSLGWFGDGACDDAEASNPGAPGPCAYAAETSCANGVDDDSDERTDCLDPDCPACGVTTPCARTEQDADGDCAADYYFWGYACGDGNDNEGDGQADCGDADCATDATCQGGGCPWWDFNCRTVPVCGDYRCEGGESCSSCSIDCGSCGGTEICDDVIDNDADGSIDCGDTDCAPDGRCRPETSCDDAIDNDSDGGIDCGDADCASNPACDAGCADPCDPAGGCYDNCACNPSDPICAGAIEVCGNVIDDDTDGLADCADSDCAADPACESEGDCDDAVDNDADGDIDCGDGDCFDDPSCDWGCEDPNACNYGNSGSCTYDCCPDDDADGLNDDTGEECPRSGGCSDSNAYNYDPAAPVGGDREESCEYRVERRASIFVADGPIARGPESWIAAAAGGALGDFLAADPGNIQGFVVALRVSLSKTSAGNVRFTISGQVAPETGSGKWPMGFVQASPTFSFTRDGIVKTPPYVSDDHLQAYIHRAIDGNFYGEKAAMMHSILQQTTDVWHYIHGND